MDRGAGMSKYPNIPALIQTSDSHHRIVSHVPRPGRNMLALPLYAQASGTESGRVEVSKTDLRCRPLNRVAEWPAAFDAALHPIRAGAPPHWIAAESKQRQP